MNLGQDIYIIKVSRSGVEHTSPQNRLNTELAKKLPECLEYVVVHELVHLLEPSHNATFIAYMDKFMPQWRHFREELNRAPLGHVEWEY